MKPFQIEQSIVNKIVYIVTLNNYILYFVFVYFIVE